MTDREMTDLLANVDRKPFRVKKTGPGVWTVVDASGNRWDAWDAEDDAALSAESHNGFFEMGFQAAISALGVEVPDA